MKTSMPWSDMQSWKARADPRSQMPGLPEEVHQPQEHHFISVENSI
jgi:hypothetical protein